MQIQEKGTNNGVAMDIVAHMVATKSSTSSVLLHYPILNALLSYGTILNTIRMKPFLS